YNRRATQLCDALASKSIAPNALGAMTAALLPILFGSAFAVIAGERTRVAKQFQPEYDLLTQKQGKPVADVFVDTLLVLETAAQLATRDEMKIYGIPASDAELAGAQLFAFAGFLDRTYRDHDYDVGRQKAQAFLQNAALNAPGELGPIRYTPQALRP